MVTNHGSPEGSLSYTVFAKKVSKMEQKGVPPVFDRKIQCATFLGGVDSRLAEVAFPPWETARGGKKATSASLLKYTPPKNVAH